MGILELFCCVDEFWVRFEPEWRRELLAAGPAGKRKRLRPGELHPSEIMTILIWSHQSHYPTVKADYTEHVQARLRGEFPALVSYQRNARADALAAPPADRLPAHAPGGMLGHRRRRLHPAR